MANWVKHDFLVSQFKLRFYWKGVSSRKNVSNRKCTACKTLFTTKGFGLAFSTTLKKTTLLPQLLKQARKPGALCNGLYFRLKYTKPRQFYNHNYPNLQLLGSGQDLWQSPCCSFDSQFLLLVMYCHRSSDSQCIWLRKKYTVQIFSKLQVAHKKNTDLDVSDQTLISWYLFWWFKKYIYSLCNYQHVSNTCVTYFSGILEV